MLRSRIAGSMAGIHINRRLLMLANCLIAAITLAGFQYASESAVDGCRDIPAPREAMLPVVTLTDEIKVGMFFDELRIDPAEVDVETVRESLRPWEPYIKRYSVRYGIDPDLVRAIIYTESRGNPYSISNDGALGLMQIMPQTADFMGIADVMDPEANINAGVKYIAWIVRHYGERNLLWAWNAGPGKISLNRMPGETKRFIVEVISIRTYLKDNHQAI